MQDRIIEIVEQKLTQALHEVNTATQEQARAAWSSIGPAPSCPAVGTVMRTMHQALGHGYRERERIAKQVISATLAPVRGNLTRALVERVMAIVNKAFPGDTFLALAQHTPDVYKRRLAPVDKFDTHIFSVEFALISASAANMSRQAVQNIQTALDEMLLHEATANPAWWKRTPSAIGKFIILPTIKWIFGIVSAVLIAAILYVLGVK